MLRTGHQLKVLVDPEESVLGGRPHVENMTRHDIALLAGNSQPRTSAYDRIYLVLQMRRLDVLGTRRQQIYGAT